MTGCRIETHTGNIWPWKADLAALQFLVALLKRPWIGRKFNVNQPRVPRGNENGGQWTDGSDWGAPSEAVVREGQDPPPGFVRISDKPHAEPPIVINPDPPKPGIGHNGPPSETPPEIPQLEAGDFWANRRLARRVAIWIAAATPALLASELAGDLIQAMVGIAWFAVKFYPYVKAYLQPARSLKELQDAVAISEPGTEIHILLSKRRLEEKDTQRR